MLEPDLIVDYVPRSQFESFHVRSERFACIVTHRRAGKTVACVEDLQRAAMWCAKVRPRFAYISPFLKQSKAVAWDYLRAATGPLRRHGARVHESELRVDYAIERCASKCYAKNIRSWVIYITVRSRASL